MLPVSARLTPLIAIGLLMPAVAVVGAVITGTPFTDRLIDRLSRYVAEPVGRLQGQRIGTIDGLGDREFELQVVRDLTQTCR